jgi:hypothetical protein
MVGCMLLSLGAKAQQVVKLDLQRTIEIANDSSLSGNHPFIIKRMYKNSPVFFTEK